MKNMKVRENLVLACTLLLLMAPVAVFAVYMANKHQWLQGRLAEVEPRYARLLGLEAQREDLQAALQKAQSARAQYVYPAGQDAAQAGNAAQQRVRDIFSGAGLQVISSQVLPAKVEKGYDRIPLSVRVEGGMLGLQSALAVLPSQAPVIVINDMDIQLRSGPANAEPYLAVQFSFSVLRARS